MKAIHRAVHIAGTQKQLAAILGVHKSQVCRWVNDKAPVPARQAMRIEALLNSQIRAQEFDIL